MNPVAQRIVSQTFKMAGETFQPEEALALKSVDVILRRTGS